MALADFIKATNLDSSVSYYWINCSMAEYNLGKKEEAKTHIVRGLKLGMRLVII